MKSLFLPAVLIFTVACGKSDDHETARTPNERAPEVGAVETVYEVLNESLLGDELKRRRAGFVNKTRYNSGRVVYWVLGPNYREKRGYVLTNNRAFKYEWLPGNTRPTEVELVADTRNANVRRILGHDRVVVLEAIDQDKLARELLGDRYTKPAATAPDQPADDDGGCGCGE